MPTEPAPSVLSSWTRTIVDALDAAGIAAEEVVREAGVDPQAFGDPNARVPVVAMARLWRIAAERVGDPAFGLKVSKYVRQTTFHALGLSLFASDTLADAMERLVRFNRVVSDVATLELMHAEGRAELQVVLQPNYRGSGGKEAMDAVLSLLTRALRALAGRDFPLESVALRRPAPEDRGPYESFFRCPVCFESPVDALVFDAKVLAERLPTGNPELARFSDAAVREYLARIAGGTIADRARAAIAEGLGKELSPASVAKRLGFSLRSLQRTLAEEGTSYEALLREIREAMAKTLLKERRHSISEIAFLLGYENLGAFARAFKRWTGVSPSDYASS
jgi:AraC-like DNA-binding protein